MVCCILLGMQQEGAGGPGGTFQVGFVVPGPHKGVHGALSSRERALKTLYCIVEDRAGVVGGKRFLHKLTIVGSWCATACYQEWRVRKGSPGPPLLLLSTPQGSIFDEEGRHYWVASVGIPQLPLGF